MSDPFAEAVAHGAEAGELVEAIRPVLAGHSPSAQGAALADLLAMWLAGHVAVGDERATRELREALLRAHVKAVRLLIPVNHRGLIEPELKRRQH